MIPSWFHSKPKSRPVRPARRTATVKPRLERFEERTVPAFLNANYAAGSYAAAVATGDFQGVGDGAVDFAVANIGTTTPGTVSALYGNGDGTFQAPNS